MREEGATAPRRTPPLGRGSEPSGVDVGYADLLQAIAAVAFFAPIQATTPKPILLIMSAML